MFPKTVVGAAVMATLLLAAAVASAGAGDGKITICHHAEGQARTIEVSQAAWSAHEGHGDHKGPCRGGQVQETHHSGAEAAKLDLTLRAAGDWDGEAKFRIHLHNEGAEARDVTLSGSLRGHGEWRVRSADADCAIEGRVLECDAGDVPAGEDVVVALFFDGGPRVCSEPGIEVAARASNAPYDEASTRTRAGACTLAEEVPVSAGDAPL